MSFGLQNTLVFVLLIVLGILLQKKISKPDETKGIKSIILNLALPATIFIALLKIEVDKELLLFPIMALLLNVVMMIGAFFIVNIMQIPKDSEAFRSILLLFPSFAPGLSCFPFLMEYFGEEALANAAFADVGNKVFVLIIMYLLAMRWYYQRLMNSNNESAQTSNLAKLKEFALALLREPINMVLITAMIILGLGWNMDTFPVFIGESINRLSIMMTPLILLFIGLSLRVSKEDVSFVIQLLLWRSGIALILSGALILVLASDISTLSKILIVIFPQSACSFWPFAHMSAVHTLEKGKSIGRTFDLTLSLNILAFSLPLSTLLILALCTNTDLITNPGTTFSIGASILALAIVPLLYKYLQPFFSAGSLIFDKNTKG